MPEPQRLSRLRAAVPARSSASCVSDSTSAEKKPPCSRYSRIATDRPVVRSWMACTLPVKVESNGICR